MENSLLDEVRDKPARLAVSVALLKEGRVLLVRRGRAPAKGLYAFPGGRVEEGETMEAAARRELREETGLVADRLTPLRTLRIEAERAGAERFDLTVFVARDAFGTLTAGDDAEHAAFHSPDELAALSLTDSTRAIVEELLAGSDEAPRRR